MRRLLVIAWYFPPDGGAGTQRLAKFCKYLPAGGWEPVVVTRTPPERRGEWEPEDRSLEDDIGAATRVIRVPPSPEVPGWVADLPEIDTGREWIAPAFDTAVRAAKEHSADAIFLSMSPFTLSFVGRRLAEETDLPVVLDLRDPWALDGWRVRRGRAAWRRDFQAMSDALRNVAGIIANTPESRREFLKRIPALEAGRVEVVPNGYDAEDFEGLEVPPADRDRFRLVHSGTLHSKLLFLNRGLKGWIRRRIWYRPEPIDTSGRTLHHLLAALNLLRGRGHPLPDSIEIVVVGQIDESTRRDVAAAGMTDQVRCEGYVPHRDAIAWLLGADALFLPLHGLPPDRRSLIVPGKAYEYLASGRPILGCLPAGDAHDLVDRCGRGYLAAPCDPREIADTLETLHADWTRGDLDGRAVADWVPRYERQELTRKLAAFLDTLVET